MNWELIEWLTIMFALVVIIGWIWDTEVGKKLEEIKSDIYYINQHVRDTKYKVDTIETEVKFLREKL